MENGAFALLEQMLHFHNIFKYIIFQIWSKGLTLYMLGNFSYFCCRLLTFCKSNYFKKFFQETNGLDPDQVLIQQSPNCLQRLSADEKSR